MDGFTAGEMLKLMTMRRSKKRDLTIRQLNRSMEQLPKLRATNAPAWLIENAEKLLASRVAILRDMIGGK